MLSVNNLSRSFAGRTILDSISFIVNPGDRVGLIGPNGAGKSTLLRTIAGLEPANTGSISLSPGERIAMLRQGFADLTDGTLANLADGPTDGLVSASLNLDSVLAISDDSESWLTQYDHAMQQFDSLGGYGALAELESGMAKLGIGGRAWTTPLDQLSGGEKTRAGLAALITARADYLLLDEPTNHLDLDGQAALSDLLSGVSAGVLIVSHDRQFLDNFATSLVVLDDQSTGARLFTGSFGAYEEAIVHEAESQSVAYRQQQEMIGRVRSDIRSVSSHALKNENSTRDSSTRRLAKKVAKTAKVRERKLERLIESEELVERPEKRWTMAADFAPVAESGRDVVQVENASVQLGGQTILTDVNLWIRSGDRIAITGRNGAGKTTLMRLITGDLQPNRGTVKIGANVLPGWFAQEGETLVPTQTPVEMIRLRSVMTEGDARAFLHKFLFTAANAVNPISTLSYGERSRLALALLVLDGCNLLLLDEPLNHLDITSRGQFEAALSEFSGTLVIVLHDLYAVERICNRRLDIANGLVHEISL